MRGGGGEGLGGKRCCRRVLLISVGEEAFLSVGKRAGALPAAIFLAFQTDRESMSARNSDRWTLFAHWIALKYMFRATQARAGEA